MANILRNLSLEISWNRWSKNLAQLAVLGLVSWSNLACHPIAATESDTPKNIIVLIDRTVDNRNELVAAMNQSVYQILRTLEKEPTRLLNSRVCFSYIDDYGERPKDQCVHVDRRVGRKSENIAAAIAELAVVAARIKELVKKDPKRYTKSLYLEAVTRAIRENDEILIIGDLAIVDGPRNFEVNRMGHKYEMTALAQGKKVDYHRVSRPKQQKAQINRIETWWNQSLYGKNTKPTVSLSFSI